MCGTNDKRIIFINSPTTFAKTDIIQLVVFYPIIVFFAFIAAHQINPLFAIDRRRFSRLKEFVEFFFLIFK